MGMKPHLVRQGEHLALLALRMGFDADKVWKAAENKSLRDAGRLPEILAAGDVLFVPSEPDGPKLKVKPKTTNSYTATIPKVSVTLTLLDETRKPFASKSYTVYGAGEPIEDTTDGNGNAKLTLPVDVTEVTLELDDSGHRFHIRVGHLDPLETPSGAMQRLVHLGYLSSARLHLDAIEDLIVRNAIMAFQRAQAIDVTGIVDAATQSALKSAHGS